MMGALICVDVGTGERFKIGTGFTDDMRRIPPKVGEIVTYEYDSLTKAGKPRFPRFVAVRDYE